MIFLFPLHWVMEDWIPCARARALVSIIFMIFLRMWDRVVKIAWLRGWSSVGSSPAHSLFIGCVVFPVGFSSAIASFAREKISVAQQRPRFGYESDKNNCGKTKRGKRAEEQNIENTNICMLQIFLYYNR